MRVAIARFGVGLAAGCAVVAALAFAPATRGVAQDAPGAATDIADVEAQLNPYGEWVQSASWGRVWLPSGMPADWQPYAEGYWAYTDEWGWYWVADEPWGAIPFHYGRWVRDDRYGWAWIPGTDWAPAWVQWRDGDDHVGWAPLPPDEAVVVTEYEPAIWVFVPVVFFLDRHVRHHKVTHFEAGRLLRATHKSGRTILPPGRHIALNRGIDPAQVAAAAGTTIVPSIVRPVVLPGTGPLGADRLPAGRVDRGRVLQRESIRPAPGREIGPAALPQPTRAPIERELTAPTSPALVRPTITLPRTAPPLGAIAPPQGPRPVAPAATPSAPRAQVMPPRVQRQVAPVLPQMRTRQFERMR